MKKLTKIYLRYLTVKVKKLILETDYFKKTKKQKKIINEKKRNKKKKIHKIIFQN